MEYIIVKNKIIVSGYENGVPFEGIYSDDGSGRTLEEQAQEIVDRKAGNPIQAAKDRIEQGFEHAMAHGILNSSLGFAVDARRSGSKNDLQNIEALIDMGATEIKDANGIMHAVTAENLNMIKSEIQQYAIGLYQKKWRLEAQIEASTTDEELNAIRW